jgi:lipopolysaccharide/colanic/teichoic acid biosynthesis glycosyltransferase
MTLQVEEEPQTMAASTRRPVSRWGDFPPPPPVRPERPALETRSEPRLLGRIAALVMLVLLAPVFILVATVVKLSAPGAPVFYRQERVGIDRRHRNGPVPAGSERRKIRGFGKPFLIWKFRTMIPNAEARTGPVWAAEADPRVTRIGRILRQLRLDELPQFLNVVAGEMSLIGPRPERPHFVEKLSVEMPTYERRLTVPPGITGLAQVEREYDASVSDVKTKLKYDLFYVKNRSTIMDVKILLKTVDVVLRGRGAR